MRAKATNATSKESHPRWRRALARAGRIGLWFFFLKGLAWILVPLGIWIAR
jgi:hypothetical protein